MALRLVLLTRLPLARLALGLALLCSVAPPVGAADAIDIAPEALPSGLSATLGEGLQLESQQRWADALVHYERALREHPEEPQLKRRFQVARLHFGVERRYADASFCDSLDGLTNDSASELYRELLRKIQTHYVTAPPWQESAEQGAMALEIALQLAEFRTRHGIHAQAEQVRLFNAELRRAIADQQTWSQDTLLRIEDYAERLASYRLGLSPVAVATEFAAATADGLDNYSSFLTPDQLRDVYSQIEGNFVGLGVELKGDHGALQIVRVIPGSPAAKSDIREGDRIVAVDNRQTDALSTDEAAALLTGEEGSIVQVTVVRPDAASAGVYQVAKPVGSSPVEWAGKPATSLTLSVRREHVDVPSLEGVRILDPQYGVAYARIPVFQKSTSQDLDAALWDLHRQGMRSLVLDLRGNPGGLLTSSVELADKFVAQGNIVSTRGRSEGEDFDYRAHRAGTWRVPLVVLIDGDSASASEIFAAAIKDNRRGTLVGERSFGKGSVQGIFPLGLGGAGVRLTTAKFYSPNGQPISKVGVLPDIDVRLATGSASGRPEGGDVALERAIETARRQVAMR